LSGARTFVSRFDGLNVAPSLQGLNATDAT
jgi:hypothetical protein